MAFTVFDDGSGDALYAGGGFTTVDGVAASRISKWNGANWSPLGTGVNNTVRALAVYNDGTGSALFAGGSFGTAGGVSANRVAKWDGSNWSALGVGVSGVVSNVDALATYHDGTSTALYVGGSFTTAGGSAVSRIARWDGAQWSSVGGGISGSVDALAVFDDGTGAALYAGGAFLNAGGAAANFIAKWNGLSWTSLGVGMSNAVYALAVYDDGGGSALYAGGTFAQAGGMTVGAVAKWNGSIWSPLGVGASGGAVHALTVYNDGTAPTLIAGGDFSSAGGASAEHIARWNGTSWSAMGIGTGNRVEALRSYDDGGGRALFVGGHFSTAGGLPASFVAKWGCAITSAGSTYCTAGTTTNGCVPAISGIGAASASSGSGFTLSVANVEGQKAGLVFYGMSGALASPWGSGGTSYLCVKAPTQRTGAQNSGGAAGSCDGTLSEDWNAFIASHSGALGQPFVGGEAVRAQAWFRDPAAVKTTNLSDGLLFVVEP